MRTFFRANEAHIPVTDAKKAILEYSPPGDWVNIFVGVNGIEETPDGRIKVEQTKESRYVHFLDESFPNTCAELGVEPRYMFDPHRKGYTGARDDAVYVLLHEDFVKVAKRYEVLVAIGQIELQPDPKQPLSTAANDNGKRWDEKVLKEMKAYKEVHGLKKTAHQYGVSQTRISDVLRKEAERLGTPKGKAKAKTAWWGGNT